jgi:predicted RNA-binding Zn-ribbon protein involved in translation (DUF1610 family)
MARFFCDNCGAEVKRNSGRCPRCGRYFDKVLCPQCGFAGEESLFKSGCPACGYCMPPEPKKNSPPVKDKGHLVAAGKLPLWVYLLAGLSLIAVGAVLYFSMD